MAVHRLKHNKHDFRNTTSTAVIISNDAGEFSLLVKGVTATARKAVSCLVEPREGDKVLCYFDELGSYILSVLESEARDNTHIKIDGSLLFETENDIAFVSENLNLVSRSSTNMLSDKVNITSNAATFLFDDIKLHSKKSISNIDHHQLVSKTTETVADTSTQRFNNSFRFIECLDQLNAGNLMQSVKNLFSTRSKQAVMLADQDVKIDGERIHMG